MRVPFLMVAGSLAAVAMFVLLGLLSWLNQGCTPAQVEAKAIDVGEIAIADAVCVSENLILTDAEIIQRCGPSDTSTAAAEARAVTVTKYIYYCRHPQELRDGGYRAGDGNLE